MKAQDIMDNDYNGVAVETFLCWAHLIGTGKLSPSTSTEDDSTRYFESLDMCCTNCDVVRTCPVIKLWE